MSEVSYQDVILAGMWLYDNHKILSNRNRYNHFVLDVPGQDGQLVLETEAEFIQFAKSKGWKAGE